MDLRVEDTMVRQIEKNLSDHINENLFLTGSVVKNDRLSGQTKYESKLADEALQKETEEQYPLVSTESISTPGISRAEYIRQAREACLRQLSSVQIYSKPYEVNYMKPEVIENEELEQKKEKVMSLFHETKQEDPAPVKEDINKDLISYHSLLIRCVCAIAVFLSIFLMDKFDVTIGKFSHTMIKDYVTGNDVLKQLENIIVTWLK